MARKRNRPQRMAEVSVRECSKQEKRIDELNLTDTQKRLLKYGPLQLGSSHFRPTDTKDGIRVSHRSDTQVPRTKAARRKMKRK